MASRRVEKDHNKSVEQILSSGGMVCMRSPSRSLEPSTVSPEPEEPVITEEEYEETALSSPLVSSSDDFSEEYPEEENTCFPSPSLRRILPDKLRKLEQYNRIHVLPKEFKTSIDPALIPKIAPQIKYIDIIADLVGCTEYKSSLAEFWFLDTLANLLRRAQEDQLPRTTQAVLMLWFCEWMKEIQNFDAADRQRMLRRFKSNMLSAARFIAGDDRLPTPYEAGVYYKPFEEAAREHEQKVEVKEERDQHLVTFQGCEFQCAMTDLIRIMHYIFDLFSTDYQFDLVRSIFTFSPDYNLIDMPYTLQNPKRLYAPAKMKKDKPKKEPKKEKDVNKQSKKKEPDTAEYIALMELKAKEEREILERQVADAEKWQLRSSILPLGLAGTDELFHKYWPPPPPESEPVSEVKPAKGKKGK